MEQPEISFFHTTQMQYIPGMSSAIGLHLEFALLSCWHVLDGKELSLALMWADVSELRSGIKGSTMF